ncbi:unnamed protein product [Urochloa humidicola]
MEAPLHQLPVPLPPPPEQDTAALGAALLRQAAAARAIMMTAAAQNHHQQPTPAAAMRREQCPRCASRDTKFCYYNNYNTAQPRHFCRACRRYWTLGGSLRNVPVGGSTRNKRPRPARPTRAIAAAVAAASGSGGGPFAAATSSSAFGVAAVPAPSSSAAGLLGSLLLGSPLLEGRLGSGNLVLGQQAAMLAGGGRAGDLVAQLSFGAGAGPMPWPTAAAATVLEGDRVETEAWKPAGGAFPLPLQPAAAALWQELAAAALPAVEAGAGMLHHGGSAAPHLLM